MEKLNFSKNFIQAFLTFLPLLTFIQTSKNVIILPLYDASIDEPNQFSPDSIYKYYSKSNVCTSIRFGKPGLDLQVILEEQRHGFYINDQGCHDNFFSSEYSPEKSSTFYSDGNLNMQYINEEATNVLEAEETITLFKPLEEYFYSSTTLDERTSGKYQKPVSLPHFQFLYIPNSEEIEKINEKKTNKKNDTESSENVNEKEEKKDEKKNNNSEYGDPYTPTYDEYGNLVFGNDKKDDDGFINPFDDYNNNDVFDNDNIVVQNSHLCGHLGLSSPSYNNPSYMTALSKNFINQLKDENVIDNYYWYVRFNKDLSGEFIIGAAPHEIKPNNYLEEDLNTANAKYINEFYYWEISFNSIYYTNGKNKEIKSKTEKSGLISFDYNFIIADNEYYNNIYKDYFEEYINKNICKNHTVKESYNKYNVIYCDEKKFPEAYMKKFPELNLKSPDFNYVFKLDYKDVFMTRKNQVIFKVIFPSINTQSTWTLGKLFLAKYQFVFNHDSKSFGFYTTFIPEVIEGDHEKGKMPVKAEKEENKLKPSNRKRNKEKKNKGI